MVHTDTVAVVVHGGTATSLANLPFPPLKLSATLLVSLPFPFPSLKFPATMLASLNSLSARSPNTLMTYMKVIVGF